MANWNTLKTAVADVINANGNQAITGQLLQNVLNNIITNVGENATFAGIATTDTNPGAPDGPVFYLATTAGVYSNFGGYEVKDKMILLQWKNNTWNGTYIGPSLKKLALIDESLFNCMFVDSYQDLLEPVEELDYVEGKVLKADGSEFPLSEDKSPYLYTITNINSSNEIKYIKHDFGSQQYYAHSVYINCALYNKDGYLIGGCLTSGEKIIQLPANYTLKIAVRRRHNDSKIFSSFSLVNPLLQMDKDKLFMDCAAQALFRKQPYTEYTHQYISLDGTMVEAPANTYKTYTISNSRAGTYLNDPLFVEVDFGKGAFAKEYFNYALYSQDGTFIKGLKTSGKCLLRIPANHIIKVTLQYENVPFISDSLIQNVTTIAESNFSFPSVPEYELKQLHFEINETGFIYEENIAEYSDEMYEIFGYKAYKVSMISSSASGSTICIYQISQKDLALLKDKGNLVNIIWPIISKNMDFRLFVGYRVEGKDPFIYLPGDIRYNRSENAIQASLSRVDLSSVPANAHLQFYLFSVANERLDAIYFMPPVVFPSSHIAKVPARTLDKEARRIAERNTKLIEELRAPYLTVKNAISITEIEGYYINIYGIVTEGSGWKYTEPIDIKDYEKIAINTKINGGKAVAVISFYDENDNYLGFTRAGVTSDTVDNISNEYDLKIKTAYKKVRVSTNTKYEISVIGYLKGTNTSINKVQTWGDSITFAGQYQKGIASELNITPSAVKNAGIGSDYSMHVRNRFISYFTDDQPYVGTGTYSVPALSERKTELLNSFFVFWLGTNNLINPDRKAGSYTTGNSAYTALQPNPDFKYDRLYSRSYKDMMLDDIRQIVNLLPHTNFAIIGGHGGFSSDTTMRQKMLEVDEILARMYPRNYIDIRELVCMDYDYQNTFLQADFAKPALNESVTITLTDTSWIGNNKNPSRNICIGTKTTYDKYNVVSIDGNNIVATLVESNTEFIEGDTMRKEYLLVSDLGRDAVNIKTQVFSYEDCVSFGLMSFPRSSSDPIHFTNEQYIRIGELIGKEIKKIVN